MSRKIINDKHALYLASVQDPMGDIFRIEKIYSELFNKNAISLREDFSGTFALACCWVQAESNRIGIAIDLDKDVIDYGMKNYYSKLSKSEQDRLTVVNDNSIKTTDAVDIINAFNFSYCLLHNRSELVKYFKNCLDSLNDEGMLIIDCFGGSDSEILEIQERYVDNDEYIEPFTFQFERKSFNPITRRSNYGIHFIFDDGTKIMDAFSYDFRMWTITEIRDAMNEAGLSSSKVYWEDFDEEELGNGQYFETEVEENSINWNAYVVGIK